MIGRILIVDDEKDMLLLLKRIITEEMNYEVVTESDPVRAWELFTSSSFDVVITDLKMPGMDGIEFLERIKKLNPETPVVILTAYATIENAVEAIHKGAYDYLTKPFRRERLLLMLQKLMDWQRIVKENLALKEALHGAYDKAQLIGSSQIMNKILDQMKRVAPSMATVLITGASGTGKELAARAIHKYSLRKDRDMVVVNCTSIPENVLESEFFGHVKGAFTGAWKDKKGLVEEADGGTLFLDEIGDLSPTMQTKILRLLQEGEYKPVGSVITKKADIRFIAATNHNLKEDIREKHFREDLFYRLNVIHFELPTLAKRKEDIPLLTHHFLHKYSLLNNKTIRAVSTVAMQALVSKDYPGNVRELENTIERGVIFCESDTLKLNDLGLTSEDPLLPDMTECISNLTFREAKNKIMDRFHRHYIGLLLEKSGGNISRAAELAGIQRQYLHRLLKDINIETTE